MTRVPTSFALGGLEVGAGAPCRVVAEVAQAHDGSLGTAHAYIDAVAGAGAHAIKFQTHIADAESTPGEPFRVKFSKQDASRYDYWKRMEFTGDEWIGLREHAVDKGLVFLSSAFSDEAVALLERVGVPGWKVGAGEITNLPMIRRIAQSGPVILSSGMASFPELDAAVEAVLSEGSAVSVLQCTSAYPCPPERLGLNMIGELRQRYGCPVGLSDHSGTIYAGLAAASLGASLVEVHVVFSRACYGPDTPSSVTLDELQQLTEGTRFIHRALGHPIDKDAMAEELIEMRRLFTKSIVAKRDLTAGHTLKASDLALKKPGTGLPPSRLAGVIGRRLGRALQKDEQVTEDALS